MVRVWLSPRPLAWWRIAEPLSFPWHFDFSAKCYRSTEICFARNSYYKILFSFFIFRNFMIDHRKDSRMLWKNWDYILRDDSILVVIKFFVFNWGFFGGETVGQCPLELNFGHLRIFFSVPYPTLGLLGTI